MKVDINIECGLDGLDKKLLTKINKLVDEGKQNGLETIRKMTEDKIQNNLTKYNIPNETVSSMVVVATENGVHVSVGGEDLLYVEYGTGIVGSSDPHPDPTSVGWRYDINNHGEAGWWYPTTADDTNPTKKEVSGGFIAWSAGVRARPFMFDTWLWLSLNANSILTKAIADSLKKLT